MPQRTETDLIIRQESAFAERRIALFRCLFAGLGICADLPIALGLAGETGLQLPLTIVGADSGYLLVAVILYGLLRRGIYFDAMPFLVIAFDFVFATSYGLIVLGAGVHSDLVAGMAMYLAVMLIVLGSLRDRVSATLFTSFLGVVFLVVLSSASGAGLVIGLSFAILVLIIGSIATYVSFRHHKTIHLIVERSQFTRFLPRQVVDTVIGHEADLHLGGKEVRATVLFCDIVGFTTMCERMPPLKVLALLNDYFSAASAVVFKYNGTLDKFVGDAMMAVFGAPITAPDDAERALKCAVGIRDVVQRINAEKRNVYDGPIRIGIGLHTGRVVAGTLGSNERMDYTVIGDTVNVAARVEHETRNQPHDIIVTQATLDAAPGCCENARLGEVALRGREVPMALYAVKGLAKG